MNCVLWGSCLVHSQQLTTWPLIYHAVIMTEMFHWSSRVPAWNVTRPHFENTWLSYGTYDTDCKLLFSFPLEISRVIILRTRGCLFVATQSSCPLTKEDPNYNVGINTAIFNDFFLVSPKSSHVHINFMKPISSHQSAHLRIFFRKQ